MKKDIRRMRVKVIETFNNTKEFEGAVDDFMGSFADAEMEGFEFNNIKYQTSAFPDGDVLYSALITYVDTN